MNSPSRIIELSALLLLLMQYSLFLVITIKGYRIQQIEKKEERFSRGKDDHSNVPIGILFFFHPNINTSATTCFISVTQLGK